MAYEDTMQMGGGAPRRPHSDEERPTEVMGPGAAPQYPPPPTVGPQQPQAPYQPAGGDWGPPASGAAKTEIMHKPPSTMAWLAVKSGPRTGHLYRLVPEVTAIGRDSHNDIIVDDAAVSRQHAKLKLELGPGDEKQFYVYDLATANGTKVNGEEVVKAPVYDGDEVEIGRTVFVFKQIDGPAREEPAGEPEPEGE